MNSVDRVQIQNINLEIDGVEILSDLNLDAQPGIHVFLGPNGAGKTMTNKILAMLLSPTKGRVVWDENKIVNPIEDENTRISLIRKIGYMSQKAVFLNKSVEQNVDLPLEIRGISKEDRNEIVGEKLEEFNLTELAKKPPHKLSLGQQQKVALLRSVIHNPNLLILDEPTASLDLANLKWFENYILNHKDNRIVFWTTHDQFQAKRLADYVYIFINGTILEKGTKDIFATAKDERVKKYLTGELL